MQLSHIEEVAFVKPPIHPYTLSYLGIEVNVKELNVSLYEKK